MTVPVASLEESTMTRRTERTHGHRNHSVKSDHERTTRTNLFLWKHCARGLRGDSGQNVRRIVGILLREKDEMKWCLEKIQRTSTRNVAGQRMRKKPMLLSNKGRTSAKEETPVARHKDPTGHLVFF